MKPQAKLTIVLSLAIGLFVFFTVYFFHLETKPRELPVLGTVAPFELKDSDDKPFGLENLQGKTWVVAFIFTTCGDVCPMMTKNLAALHRSYALRDDVAMVAVTVNPEYDDPKILKDFARKQNADTKHWHFLTGSRQAITDLMLKTFKIGSKEEPIFHSTKFVLVDKQGRIRGYYDGMDKEEVEVLFKDIANTLKEK